METVIFFSTSSDVKAKLEDQPLVGIIMRQLQPPFAENGFFDFSCINFVANVDLKKISMKSAIKYLMSECFAAKGKHYIELDGRRLSVHDTNTIYAEADKIDQRYMLYNHPGDSDGIKKS
ncbi:hypothetical protein [Desulforhopalus sp. IMCC35007]|uniref:hypothetical protein n=1 Tax=Desulforhopalus sp. IMCC35007 TaxID=2569543 RepID=UPI0010AE39C0|nr:hypothetical protein [Desulforhopalus sp. IMCC35007]TKB05863.1 hypothetical protein FCL48_23360 [Desulforhopalus sp. IMCC35007]